jgi:hypothetical protein
MPVVTLATRDFRSLMSQKHMGLDGTAVPIQRDSTLAQVKAILRLVVQDVQLLFRKPSYGPKVFCIGFNKTGTTSLGQALEILGYHHSSFNRKVWVEFYLKGRFDKLVEYTAKFDSFDDLPWLKQDMIPILDKRFPGSKYIYLERDESSWKRSLARWGELTFGSTPDVDVGWKEYLAHREFVLNYFKGRSPKEFMVLDVRDPVGFRKLANFLGKAAPQDALPHQNRTDELR